MSTVSSIPVRPALSAQINQAFVNELLSSLGGIQLGGAEAPTNDLLTLSHRIGEYLVDFRNLEHDPKNIMELYERAEAFAADRRMKGSIADTVQVPGEATRAYWRKFLATSIDRELDRAAAHVRYCRAYLYQPQLQGVVFFVNQSIPLVELSHLEYVIGKAQARHQGSIALCVFHCRLPGLGSAASRLLQGVVPSDSEHAGFGTRFLDKLNEQLNRMD